MHIFLVIAQVFFNLKGPNHTRSADDHDKLMDFIRDTFPSAVDGL